MYERLQAVAGKADMTIGAIAREAGVTGNALYQLKFREPKGGSWNTATLNSVSAVLAQRLDRKPSEIYAYLTGLEEIAL